MTSVKPMRRRRKNNRLIISVASSVLALIVAVIACSGTDEVRNFFGPWLSYSSKYFDTSQDFVRFLDVGQGDSILIYSNGRTALIDTGTVNYENEICADLNSCGINTIDALILSHLHADHTGSVTRIIDDYRVKNLILPELSIESEGLSAAQYAVNAVTETDGGVYNAVQGMNFTVGEFELTVLASYGDFDEENNRSLFIMAEIDDVKFLLSGDAEKQAENRILGEGLDLDCDVYKAAHHGSNTSNTEKFLKELTPRYVAISCGKDNTYGHPHNEVLQKFEETKAEVYRTDLQGDITFYVEKGVIRTESEK